MAISPARIPAAARPRPARKDRGRRWRARPPPSCSRRGAAAGCRARRSTPFAASPARRPHRASAGRGSGDRPASRITAGSCRRAAAVAAECRERTTAEIGGRQFRASSEAVSGDRRRDRPRGCEAGELVAVAQHQGARQAPAAARVAAGSASSPGTIISRFGGAAGGFDRARARARSMRELSPGLPCARCSSAPTPGRYSSAAAPALLRSGAPSAAWRF